MRITAEARERTRERIVAAAQQLFAERGFAGASTRDLASAAGIATGTLFNYFPNKEALAMSIVAVALERGKDAYLRRRRGDEPLAEDLFAHVAAGLRELEPQRGFVGEVIEAALGPFSRGAATEEGERSRLAHLETVRELLVGHGLGESPGFVSIHLYWTLYLGVLAFWSRDDSPAQEDTLVLLDRSMQLFVSSIANPTESDGGPPWNPKSPS